jgi:hypothetical protein
MIEEATIEEAGRRIGAEVESAMSEPVRLDRTLADLRIPVDILVVVEVLLQKARDDLASARTLIASDGYAIHVVGFLLQQAVEKAMKSGLGQGDRNSLATVDWLTPFATTNRVTTSMSTLR